MYTHNKYPRCYNSVTLHELTPMSADQWPTQKPYKNCLPFKKNVVSHTTFAGRPTMLAG